MIVMLNSDCAELNCRNAHRDFPQDAVHAWLRQRPADKLDGHLLPVIAVAEETSDASPAYAQAAARMRLISEQCVQW